MKEDKIMITTVPVTIRVIEVGGKKMTVSVFTQIQRGDFFDENISHEERQKMFLGWVAHKGEKYIVFHCDGVLKKDMYTHKRVDDFFLKDYTNSRRTYLERKNLAGKPGYSHITQEKVEEARGKFELDEAAYNTEKEYVSALNAAYLEYLQQDKQIFIAI